MYEKITKPNDCLFAIAIPLKEKDFYSDLISGNNKDYVNNLKKTFNYDDKQLWEYVHKPITNFINDIMIELSNLGTKVIVDFKSSDIYQILPYKVFTLLAHSVKDGQKIELFDGIITCENFVELLPSNFKGIYDMTICKSIFLQTQIKEKCRNIVIANKDSASIEFRLLFYKYLIKFLSLNNCNYLDAFTKLRIELIKSKKL